MTPEQNQQLIQDAEDMLSILKRNPAPRPPKKIQSNEIRFGFFNEDRTNMEWVCFFFDQKTADKIFALMKSGNDDEVRKIFPTRMGVVNWDDVDCFHTPMAAHNE